MFEFSGHKDNTPERDDQDRLSVEAVAEEMGILLPSEPDIGEDIGEVSASRWREYDDILTDSLWIFGARSREGTHNGAYHGNFVPQIPYQAIRRFTKPGDVVLDIFLGSGTTLIEARRLGRHGIGVELSPEIAAEAQSRIAAESNPHAAWHEVITGDSAGDAVIAQIGAALARHGCRQVQLLMMHPPYHDIIRFSDDARDLSNAPTLAAFLERFQTVVSHTCELLETGCFLVVVIGDKYGSGEWIPLGFYATQAVQASGYVLKSIVVKNMEGNRAKRNLQNLWRQRAFRGRFYIFKHEYVLFFQKRAWPLRSEITSTRQSPPAADSPP